MAQSSPTDSHNRKLARHLVRDSGTPSIRPNIGAAVSSLNSSTEIQNIPQLVAAPDPTTFTSISSPTQARIQNNFAGLVQAGPTYEAEVVAQEEPDSGALLVVSIRTPNSSPAGTVPNHLSANYARENGRAPSTIDTNNEASESGWTAYLCSSYDATTESQKTVEKARESLVTDSRRSHSLYVHQPHRSSFSMASDASSGPGWSLLSNCSFEDKACSDTHSKCRKNAEALLDGVQASDSHQTKLIRLHNTSTPHGSYPPTLEDTASSPSHSSHWQKETSNRLEVAQMHEPNYMEVFKFDDAGKQS